MGCRGSEVRIFSPRPRSMNGRSCGRFVIRARAAGQCRPTAALTIQSLRQSLHLHVKIGLTFEPYAGQFGHRDEALLHPHAIRESAVRLEKVRIALVATQAKSGGNVERHLVSAMRDATRRRPSVD